jgi:hypothetical protein
MSHIIKAISPTDAWIKGLTHLEQKEEWRDYNLILDIENPLALSDQERGIAEELGRFLEKHGKKPINTVINTIFPSALYRGSNAETLIKEYLEVAPLIRCHKDNKKWGTYFMRLASRTSATSGREIRPLEELIKRLRGQAKTGAPKRAWYELNMTDQFLELPIYDNLSDPAFMMGGPCLTHLSFKLRADQSLILTAFYRSHYYIERTLGNLYGLALLQEFVAKEAGLKMAELVCHSSMAQIDHAKPFSAPLVEDLIKKCRTLSSPKTL